MPPLLARMGEAWEEQVATAQVGLEGWEGLEGFLADLAGWAAARMEAPTEAAS